MKNNQTRTAADLAQMLAAQIETARGLAQALEKLAGDQISGHESAAGAVFETLCAQLDQMQSDADALADQTETAEQRQGDAEKPRGILLNLTTNEASRVSMACLALAQDFERDAAESKAAGDADALARAEGSAAMWARIRAKIRGQIDEQTAER